MPISTRSMRGKINPGGSAASSNSGSATTSNSGSSVVEGGASVTKTRLKPGPKGHCKLPPLPPKVSAAPKAKAKSTRAADTDKLLNGKAESKVVEIEKSIAKAQPLLVQGDVQKERVGENEDEKTKKELRNLATFIMGPFSEKLRTTTTKAFDLMEAGRISIMADFEETLRICRDNKSNSKSAMAKTPMAKEMRNRRCKSSTDDEDDDMESINQSRQSFKRPYPRKVVSKKSCSLKSPAVKSARVTRCRVRKESTDGGNGGSDTEIVLSCNSNLDIPCTSDIKQTVKMSTIKNSSSETFTKVSVVPDITYDVIPGVQQTSGDCYGSESKCGFSENDSSKVASGSTILPRENSNETSSLMTAEVVIEVPLSADRTSSDLKHEEVLESDDHQGDMSQQGEVNEERNTEMPVNFLANIPLLRTNSFKRPRSPEETETGSRIDGDVPHSFDFSSITSQQQPARKKFIMRGMDSDEIDELFREEGQILNSPEVAMIPTVDLQESVVNSSAGLEQPSGGICRASVEILDDVRNKDNIPNNTSSIQNDKTFNPGCNEPTFVPDTPSSNLNAEMGAKTAILMSKDCSDVSNSVSRIVELFEKKKVQEKENGNLNCNNQNIVKESDAKLSQLELNSTFVVNNEKSKTSSVLNQTVTILKVVPTSNPNVVTGSGCANRTFIKPTLATLDVVEEELGSKTAKSPKANNVATPKSSRIHSNTSSTSSSSGCSMKSAYSQPSLHKIFPSSNSKMGTLFSGSTGKLNELKKYRKEDDLKQRLKEKEEEVARKKYELLLQKQEIQKRKNDEWKKKAEKIKAEEAVKLATAASNQQQNNLKGAGNVSAKAATAPIPSKLCLPPTKYPKHKVQPSNSSLAQQQLLNSMPKKCQTSTTSSDRSHDDTFKSCCESVMDITAGSDTVNSYDITVYEDLDEELKHRENKKIPDWASYNIQFIGTLFQAAPVSLFKQEYQIFPEPDKTCKLYPRTAAPKSLKH